MSEITERDKKRIDWVDIKNIADITWTRIANSRQEWSQIEH